MAVLLFPTLDGNAEFGLQIVLVCFSMACWRVGELCGQAAHASPPHPGAVTCVWAHIIYCPIIKIYLLYCLACVARPCQSVPFGK